MSLLSSIRSVTLIRMVISRCLLGRMIVLRVRLSVCRLRPCRMFWVVISRVVLSPRVLIVTCPVRRRMIRTLRRYVVVVRRKMAIDVMGGAMFVL